MSGVSFDGVTKRFDGVTAVDSFSLDVVDGEFMVLLGPSGCGKSTALRMIAGLETVTAGVLRIGDRIVNNVEAKDRDIAMVFQSYALYPHMTVTQNIEFPLKARKYPVDESVRSSTPDTGRRTGVTTAAAVIFFLQGALTAISALLWLVVGVALLTSVVVTGLTVLAVAAASAVLAYYELFSGAELMGRRRDGLVIGRRVAVLLLALVGLSFVVFLAIGNPTSALGVVPGAILPAVVLVLLRKAEPDLIVSEVAHLSKAERKERVNGALEVLGLTELAKRKPGALSGGQRQRVALARAIVRRPEVFLMDEPLSNLDAKLRAQTRLDLVALHREVATTFIYVTHDQVEAMTMADRMAVMSDGRLQQVGDPQSVYERPANLFVARFIGSPPMNTIAGEVAEAGVVACGSSRIPFEGKAAVGRQVVVGIRPEHLHVGKGTIEATVQAVEWLGHERHVIVDIAGSRAIVRQETDEGPAPALGSTVTLGHHADNVHLFDAETTERIN